MEQSRSESRPDDNLRCPKCGAAHDPRVRGAGEAFECGIRDCRVMVTWSTREVKLLLIPGGDE